MNAPKTAPKTGPKRAPENAKTAKQKMFAQEMHYQVYRIDQLAKNQDALANAAATTPGLMKKPLLMRFLSAYLAKNTNEFIKDAQGKTVEEREKLLNGIRGVLHRAKTKAAGPEKAKKANQAAEKKDKELERIDKLLQRELKEDELGEWETALDTPFNIQAGKIDFKKIEKHYKTILLGQKVFGTHVVEMQKKYQSGMKSYVDHQKKYTSGWRTGLGIADYANRTVSSAWRWGTNLFRKKKNEKPNPLDKINKKIAKTRKYYKAKMARVKLVKGRIKARSDELKAGMGVYKGDVRKKLQTLIRKGDWTKRKEFEQKKQKGDLEARRKLLQAGYKRAQISRLEIEKAKKSGSALSLQLKQKVANTTAGEGVLNNRIASVKARITQMTSVYGSKTHPKVIEMTKQFLVPLMSARNKVMTAKEDRTQRLTDIQKRNNKLDVINADVYLQETTSAAAVATLDLGIQKSDKRIALLSNNRLKLHGMLQNIETAYGAVSQFKDNVGTNLDKMTKGNDKVMKGLNSQYDALSKVKATSPGLFKSLYNTAVIGKYGAMGAIEVVTQGVTRVPAYFGAKLLGMDIEWKDTKNWHAFGAVNWVNTKYQDWLEKDGFLQYLDKDSAMASKFVLGGLNTGAGVLGAAGNLVNGVVQFVKNPFEALEGLATILTDWGMFKEAMKSVIHYDDWAEGRYNIAAGRTAGDVIVLFFTAGNSAGVSAAAKASSVAGKIGRYSAGFAKGIGQKMYMLPANVGRGALTLGRGALNLGRGVSALGRGGLSGFKGYWYGERLLKNAGQASDELMNAVNKAEASGAYGRLTSPTKKLIEGLKKDGPAKFAKDGRMEILVERLGQEFNLTGLRGRVLIDKLQGSVGRWVKADVKYQAGREMLARRGLGESGKVLDAKRILDESNAVLSGKDKAVATARKAMRETAKEVSKSRAALKKATNKGKGVSEAERILNTAKESLANRVADLRAAKQAAKIAKQTVDDASKALNKIEATVGNPIKRGDAVINELKKNPIPSTRELRAAKGTIRRIIGDLEHEIRLGGATPGAEKMLGRLRKRLEGLKLNDKANIAHSVVSKHQSGLIQAAKKGGNKNVLKVLYGAEQVPVRFGGFFSRVPVIKRLFTQEKIIARRLLEGKVVSRAALEKLGGFKTVEHFATKIRNNLNAGNIKLAVRDYYSLRLAFGKLGLRSFTSLDKAFVSRLHIAIPAAAIVIGNTLHLMNPTLMAALPSKANKAALAKMNKENFQTYAAIRNSVGPSSKPSGSGRSLTGRVSGAVRGAASTVAGASTKAGREIARQSASLYASAKSKVGRAYDSASSVEVKKYANKAKKSISSWFSLSTAKSIANKIERKARSAGNAVTGAVSGPASTVAGVARRGANATVDAYGKVKRKVTGSPKAARSKEAIVKLSATLEAASKADKKMHKHLEAGNLRKAFEQFHVTRNILINGKDTRQYVREIDSAFLKYIHKVIPKSVKYIKTSTDLRNIAIIGKLPTRLPVFKDEIAKSKLRRFAELRRGNK